MPTAIPAEQPDSSMATESQAGQLPELQHERAIIADYGGAFENVDFSPQDAVESLAYVSRRVWGNYNTYAEKESFVWQLLHTLEGNPPIKDLCDFFWRRLHTSQITSSDGEAAFWALCMGLDSNAAQSCQKVDRWDLKSLIECKHDPQVINHCKHILAAPHTSLPQWEIGIYALICGDLQQALKMCSDWDQRVAVSLSVGLIHGLETREQMGGIFSELTPKDDPDYAFHSLITAMILEKVPEYLEQSPCLSGEIPTIYNDTESNQRFITNVRLDCHLAIIFGSSNIATEQAIQAYIELLLLSNNTKLIPEYVRFLNPQIQPSVYASVLGRLGNNFDEQEIQRVCAQLYKLDIDEAVSELVDMRFSNYRAEKLVPTDLQNLVPAGEKEQEMISALSWLRILQKWDLLADYCKQLLDIWLPNFQIRASLDLNQEISLSKVISVSHHATPNSRLMIELNAHYRILAFLTVLQSDERSGRAVLVRIGDADQYMSVDEIDLQLREAYLHYCYDQLLKYLDTHQDAASLKLELATHISNRPGILALLDRQKFLPQLMTKIAEDVVKNPQEISSY